MMDPILTIDSDFVTSTLAYAGQLVTDTKVLIILAIGLPLGFWVIRRLIGLIRARG